MNNKSLRREIKKIKLKPCEFCGASVSWWAGNGKVRMYNKLGGLHTCRKQKLMAECNKEFPILKYPRSKSSIRT